MRLRGRPGHRFLTVATERNLVGAIPDGLDGGTALAIARTTSSKTTSLLAGTSKTTELTVLLLGLSEPVEARVTADSVVLRVDEDDLEELICRVLVHPVRVEDAERGNGATDALLGDATKRTVVLELSDTLVDGLAVDNTLGVGARNKSYGQQSYHTTRKDIAKGK